jgi:TRAP-type C4-dicarboxylate transport system substrate-binding protein
VTASSAVQSKYYEVASEFATTNHRIFTDLMVINRSRLEELNDEARSCLMEAAEKASDVGRNAVVSLELTALTELAELGVAVRAIENRPALFEQAREVTLGLVNDQGAKEIYELILSSFTCPAWCDDSTCDDDECKACMVCE